MFPVAADVAQFLGRGDELHLIALAGSHLPIVSQMVKAYTRGNGFDGQLPNEAIAAVIVSATARLSTNPDNTISSTIDDYQVRKTVFEGFSLAELYILDGYRRKAT